VTVFSIVNQKKGCKMRFLSLIIRSILCRVFWIWLLGTVSLSGQSIPEYKDASIPVERRVGDLLSRMSVEDKVAQLQCQVNESGATKSYLKQGLGGLGCILRNSEAGEAAKRMNAIQKIMIEQSRFGIPIIMHDEALHGLIAAKATSFPQAIGLASSWDPDLMDAVAEAIAKETRSRGIRQVLSPTINIARDVRWGRIEETYGEDPYLASRMAVAFCRAFERNGVITTPKHYAANVGDGGRDSHPIHFSERLMREIYFPAFKACIMEAGCTSIMAAYNSYDGIPCSANAWLLTDVLRGEWGFRGYVVSDYGSVKGIAAMHRTAVDDKQAAALALSAGLDVELPNVDVYGQPLLEAIREGMVSEDVLDRSVRRILTAKFRLGLFENPYVDPSLAEQINDCREHRAIALEAARKALVLLKNDDDTLPFGPNVKSIAVIGPLADIVRLGGYSGSGMKTVSILEGIRKARPNAAIRFAKGLRNASTMYPVVPEVHLFPAGGREGQHGLKGEYFSNPDLEGRPVLTRIDREINFEWGGGSPDSLIPPDRFSVRWTGTLVPPVSGFYKIILTTDDGVRLFIDGKRVDEAWQDRSPTSNFIPLQFEEGRKYDIRIEYYENAGGAFAALGWDVVENEQEERDFFEAQQVVQESEAVVVVAGVIEGEGRDRAEIRLHPGLERMIRTVGELGKPTVVVLINGSAVAMNEWIHSVGAVLEAWYPGEEGGNAIADVLFGNANPGGKLPITFPLSSGQIPLYYNTKPSGRGYDYVDMPGKALFPFGHGLSYTTFEYGNLTLSSNPIHANQGVRVSVDIGNAGKVKGDEVIQLYIHDEAASVARPIKELKGFKRVTLEPGEKKTVSFDLTQGELALLDQHMKWVVEPGRFQILVGSSSSDIRCRADLDVIT